MNNEHFDPASPTGPTAVSRRKVVTLVVVSALGAATVLGSSAPAVAADVSCNCVLYVRSQTGLPGGPATAAGYTEGRMRSLGYIRVSPRGGAIVVWDAHRKGAGSSGHIAIATKAAYDSRTRKWAITVRHANWGGCGIRITTFGWGDLYGVNFYVRR